MVDENIVDAEFVEVTEPVMSSEDLEKERITKYVENLKREISENEKKIIFHKDLLNDLYTERNAVLENHDIIIANFKPLNPQWTFESNDIYLKNLTVMQGIKRKKDVNNYEKLEEQINLTIKVSEEQLESLKTALAEQEVK